MADKVYLLDVPGARSQAQDEPAEPRSMHTPRIPSFDDVPEAWVKPPPAPARRPFKAVGALVAAYTLGGIAPLALRVGPRKFAWAVVSTLSLAGWATLIWYWQPVRAAMAAGRLPILPFILGIALVHAFGALAWSRGLTRVVRDERYQPQALPRWMRHPWSAGLCGVLLPGAGLAIAGRGRRAGFALWNAASVVLAALVTSHAGLVWTWNVKSGADGLPSAFVESLFIAAVAVLVLGALLWIGSALDGARLVEQRRASFRRGRSRTTAWRADAAALGLIGALAAFALTLQPGPLAGDLDQFAGAMRFSGYRVIPLGLESLAAGLDPGRPEYQMRVAELQVDMGRPEAARAIQNRLRERWEVYAQMLLQTAAATNTTPASRPIQPARDLLPRSQELAPALAAEPESSPAQ